MPNIDIDAVKAQIDAEIEKINSAPALEDFRIKYLGRKGIVAQLTASIPNLIPHERQAFGQKVNTLKNRIASLVEEKQKTLVEPERQAGAGGVDMGMPGIAQDLGRLHPLTQVIDEICAIFMRMGFSIVEGPEIETEHNNFTGLNIPLEHPSRDVFDTFYLKLASERVSQLTGSTGKLANRQTGKLLLRSHTSPVQIRVMQSRKPPLAVVVPGRVYRPDAVDASHSFMFHQIEGFMVDKNIAFSDLKGVLTILAKAVFGKEIKMRFRPHFFPFTEPSAEVDISCIICKGKGCSVCGRKGWLEILGSGMIHPNVFKNVGYGPKKYTGFAFGMGVERIAMLKYGINDIRLFFENDMRFLKQF
ncbi:MAG: phenylalanine--tRNA ligase subunit alpha [Candidatus Omnitrophica bacterium]|nr:phenylalanine--tRNA ligase subunit alpha [Candidatus Omnitrophota bacterium]